MITDRSVLAINLPSVPLVLFNHAAREWFGGDLAGISLDAWSMRYDRYRNDGSTPIPADATPLARAFRVNTLGVAKAEIIGRPVFNGYHPDCWSGTTPRKPEVASSE
jgi:hypothetical protein